MGHVSTVKCGDVHFVLAAILLITVVVTTGRSIADEIAAPTTSPELAHSTRIERVEAGLRPFAEPPGAELKWRLEDRMRHYRVLGLSIAVIADGKVAWTKAYGTGDAVTLQAITPHTRLQAASISKFVAAVTAMRMVDQGALELDSDVNIALKSWKLPRNDEWRSRPVTLRQLLSHTGGAGPRGYIGYVSNVPVPTALQILNGEPPANSAAVAIMAEPGAAENYSGGGYQIVERLITDVHGAPFDQTARELVFAPLHLPLSMFGQPVPDRLSRDVAAGHDQGTRLPGGCFNYPELASAGLWSTPEELARLAIMLRDSLRGTEGSLISAKSAAEMLTPAPLSNQSVSHHGLGPEVSGAGPALKFGHSGGNVGFRAAFVMYLESGKGAVVMSNDNSGDALADEVLRAIAAEYRWPGDDYATQVRSTIKVEHAALSNFAGDYEIEGNKTPVAVKVTEKGLSLQMPYKSPIDLLPSEQCEFYSTSHNRSVRFKCEGDDRQATSGALMSEGAILFRFSRRDAQAR